MFPGELLEHNYPDPNNPKQLLAHSEVNRQGNYFECLEREATQGECRIPIGGCGEAVSGEYPRREAHAQLSGW